MDRRSHRGQGRRNLRRGGRALRLDEASGRCHGRLGRGRFVHHQMPPKVEYSLTSWGQALCPALDALLKWVDLREQLTERVV